MDFWYQEVGIYLGDILSFMQTQRSPQVDSINLWQGTMLVFFLCLYTWVTSRVILVYSLHPELFVPGPIDLCPCVHLIPAWDAL